MPKPQTLIRRLLAVMAMATVAAFALGFVTAEPASKIGDNFVDQALADPLWPEHLRCLVLGQDAADDRICIALASMDREG